MNYIFKPDRYDYQLLWRVLTKLNPKGMIDE